MTIELTMLAYSTALLLVLVHIPATAGVMSNGLGPMAGSRDDLPAPKPFAARARRVVDNHREGLTIFAPLVLIAAVAQVHTEVTALAAQIFFAARVAHAGLYLLGVPLVRPAAWAVGLAATLMMLGAVLGFG